MTWEWWDCQKCHQCPGGWIADVTTTTTMNPQCVLTDCKDSADALADVCPAGLVKHGLVDCGAEECTGTGWFDFCFSPTQQSKCCPEDPDQECEWWEPCNWLGLIGDLFDFITEALEDLWAALPTDLQEMFSDSSTIGGATEEQLEEVGPQLLSSLRSVKGLTGQQMSWLGSELEEMTADQLANFLSNVNAAAFVQGMSSLTDLTWTVAQAELLIERLFGSDIWGAAAGWSKKKFQKLGALINSVDPEFLAQFSDKIITSANNIKLLTGTQLAGMFAQIADMSIKFFKKLVKGVECSALLAAWEQWVADGAQYWDGKKDKKKKKKAIKKITKKCDRRLLADSTIV